MKDTGYDHPTTVLPKRASGYVLDARRLRNAPYLDMSIPYAAGSLYSTVEDLYQWDRALYTDKLLGADLKKTMFTPLLRTTRSAGRCAREARRRQDRPCR